MEPNRLLLDGSLLRITTVWLAMTASGHERRFCDVCGTSALPPILTVIADILNRQLRADFVAEVAEEERPVGAELEA